LIPIKNHVPSEATFALLQAMLGATSKLGIQGIFRRLVVSELPDTLWPPDFEMNEEAGNVSVRARHLCPPGCPVSIGHCFTALKIEEIVSKRKSRPYQVSSVSATGEEVHVLLNLFS
jgi:hypothetical protein